MMNNDPKRALSFTNVSKAFAARPVLNEVSFEVAVGETLCIMGRSGMGKSVTLKLMAGLLKADQGSIHIGDDDITKMNEDGLSRVRLQIGFLFQSAALFDSFSVNDNLALPLQRFKKGSKEEVDAVVQERLEEVGLGSDRYKMPNELSGGMRKRAGLARALVLEPSILLVDEPSSGLDRLTMREIDELLLRQKQQKHTTMVVVTHDIGEAKRLGDRLAVFSEGRLLAIGKAEELEEHADAAVRALVSEKG